MGVVLSGLDACVLSDTQVRHPKETVFAELILGEFLEDEEDWKERTSGLLAGRLCLDPKGPRWGPNKFFVLCGVQVKNMSL